MVKQLIVLALLFQLHHCFSQNSDSVLLWSDNGRWLERKIEIVLFVNNKTIVEHYSHFKHHYFCYNPDTFPSELYTQLKQNKTQKLYASYHKCNSLRINFIRNEAYASGEESKMWDSIRNKIGYIHNYSGLKFSDSSKKFTCHEQFKTAGNILIKKAKRHLDSVYEYKEDRYKNMVRDSAQLNQAVIDSFIRQYNCSAPDARALAFIITHKTSIFFKSLQQLIDLRYANYHYTDQRFKNYTDPSFSNFTDNLDCFPSDIDIEALKIIFQKSNLKWLDKKDLIKRIRHKN